MLIRRSRIKVVVEVRNFLQDRFEHFKGENPEKTPQR